MAAESAVSGFVVTAGEFTRDARAFAKGRNVELIGGATLMALLQDARETLRPALANSAVAASQAVVPRAQDNNTTPICPKCGKPMVKRTTRQGSNAGNAFWGCSGFPGCRGTRATI
jgi:restriction system protein